MIIAFFILSDVIYGFNAINLFLQTIVVISFSSKFTLITDKFINFRQIIIWQDVNKLIVNAFKYYFWYFFPACTSGDSNRVAGAYDIIACQIG